MCSLSGFQTLQPGPSTLGQANGRMDLLWNIIQHQKKIQAAVCMLSYSLQNSFPTVFLRVPEKPSAPFWKTKRQSEPFKRSGREAWAVVSRPGLDPSEDCHVGISDGFLSVLTLNYKQGWGTVNTNPTHSFRNGKAALDKKDWLFYIIVFLPLTIFLHLFSSSFSFQYL